MKKLIILFFIVTNNNNITSQTAKKIYNGVFENGTAIYEYYENKDYERIFDGSFSYTASINTIKTKSVGVENNNSWVIGQFSNNLKTGFWTQKNTHILEVNKNNYLTNIFSGNYEKGLRVGKWTYNSKGVKDSKTFEKITIFNYNKNILIGKVYSEGHIDGNINNEGVFQGTWNIKTKGKEYIAEFINGVFIKLIVRKIENGDIIFRYSTSEIYTETTDSSSLKLILNKYYLSINPHGEAYEGYAFGNKHSDEDEDSSGSETGNKSKYEQIKSNLYTLSYFEEFAQYILDYGSTDIKIELGSIPPQIIIPSIISYLEF